MPSGYNMPSMKLLLTIHLLSNLDAATCSCCAKSLSMIGYGTHDQAESAVASQLLSKILYASDAHTAVLQAEPSGTHVMWPWRDMPRIHEVHARILTLLLMWRHMSGAVSLVSEWRNLEIVVPWAILR